MVPDTCEPTWTVITALMVPVASTTSRMSPRSTLAVKCWACAVRFHPSTTKSATATTAPPNTSHLVFSFIRILTTELRRFGCSFVAQGLDGIEQGSFSCRIVSEKYTNSRREKSRYHYGLEGHLHWPLQRFPYKIRAQDSEQHSGSAAHQTQHHRLAEELQLNGFFRRADGHTHSNFA